MLKKENSLLSCTNQQILQSHEEQIQSLELTIFELKNVIGNKETLITQLESELRRIRDSKEFARKEVDEELKEFNTKVELLEKMLEMMQSEIAQHISKHSELEEKYKAAVVEKDSLCNAFGGEREALKQEISQSTLKSEFLLKEKNSLVALVEKQKTEFEAVEIACKQEIEELKKSLVEKDYKFQSKIAELESEKSVKID